MPAVYHKAQWRYAELALGWTGRGRGWRNWLRIGLLLVVVRRRAIAPAAGRRSRIGGAATPFIVRRLAVLGIGVGCSAVVLGFVRSVEPTGREPDARSAGRRGWSGWNAARTRSTARCRTRLWRIAVRNIRHSDASTERLPVSGLVTAAFPAHRGYASGNSRSTSDTDA
jgi:hypothetical protein